MAWVRTSQFMTLKTARMGDAPFPISALRIDFP
jgi:hypothetical protein